MYHSGAHALERSVRLNEHFCGAIPAHLYRRVAHATSSSDDANRGARTAEEGENDGPWAAAPPRNSKLRRAATRFHSSRARLLTNHHPHSFVTSYKMPFQIKFNSGTLFNKN